MKILTTAQMRQVEQDCAEAGLPPSVLMENAGKAVAEEVKRILGNVSQQRVLVMVGPGDNGGDGLVAARHLNEWGFDVSVCLLSERPTNDSNLEQVRERDIAVIDAAGGEGLDRFGELLPSAGAVIDAIFGTGKIRAIRSLVLQALDMVRRAKKTRPEYLT